MSKKPGNWTRVCVTLKLLQLRRRRKKTNTSNNHLIAGKIFLSLGQVAKKTQPRTQVTSSAERECREAFKSPVCSFNPPTSNPTRGALRARRVLESPMAEERSERNTSAKTRARFTVMEPQTRTIEDITAAVLTNPLVVVRMLRRRAIPRQLEPKTSLLGVEVNL